MATRKFLMEQTPVEQATHIELVVVFRGRVFVDPIVRFSTTSMPIPQQHLASISNPENIRNIELDGPDVLKVTLHRPIPVSTCTTRVVYLRAQ